jgi:hypothetical protein
MGLCGGSGEVISSGTNGPEQAAQSDGRCGYSTNNTAAPAARCARQQGWHISKALLLQVQRLPWLQKSAAGGCWQHHY